MIVIIAASAILVSHFINDPVVFAYCTSSYVNRNYGTRSSWEHTSVMAVRRKKQEISGSCTTRVLRHYGTPSYVNDDVQCDISCCVAFTQVIDQPLHFAFRRTHQFSSSAACFYHCRHIQNVPGHSSAICHFMSFRRPLPLANQHHGFMLVPNITQCVAVLWVPVRTPNF